MNIDYTIIFFDNVIGIIVIQCTPLDRERERQKKTQTDIIQMRSRHILLRQELLDMSHLANHEGHAFFIKDGSC